MAYDGDSNCCVCNKKIERAENGKNGRHHVCNPKTINRIEGLRNRDPLPPTKQSWAARLSQGFALLKSY